MSISIHVPLAVVEEIEAEAAARGTSRSSIAREVLCQQFGVKAA